MIKIKKNKNLKNFSTYFFFGNFLRNNYLKQSKLKFKFSKFSNEGVF